MAEPAEGTGLLNLRRGNSTEGSNPSLSALFILSMKSSQNIKVRFAPSPTGYLHVGGARTALFNYFFAKHYHGEFLLRIEDTDRERSSDEMTKSILSSLKWLGIEWDGEITCQSERTERHQYLCKTLLDKELAYRCFCTPEQLATKRKLAQEKGEGYGYDGTCRNLSQSQINENLNAGKSFSVRFKVPSGETVFKDGVHGPVAVQNAEIDDFVILRSDGSPVYQVAVVCDDHDMEITHVIRGDDHLSNTPKQILIYQAMGWPVPEFAHVPLILGPDKKRLSKRHGATSVQVYKNTGYLPEAFLNFMILLGWSPGKDREILDKSQIIELFSIDRISKKSSVFDEQKLIWMNTQYIQNIEVNDLVQQVKIFLDQSNMPDNKSDDYLVQFVQLMKPRVKVIQDFLSADYFFKDPDTYDEAAVKKHWQKPGAKDRLQNVSNTLDKINDWSEENIENCIRKLAEDMEVSAGKLIHPIRLAISGQGNTPGLFEMMSLLGKETVHRRIQSAIPLIYS